MFSNFYLFSYCHERRFRALGKQDGTTSIRQFKAKEERGFRRRPRVYIHKKKKFSNLWFECLEASLAMLGVVGPTNYALSDNGSRRGPCRGLRAQTRFMSYIMSS